MMPSHTIKRIALVMILVFSASAVLGIDVISGGLITNSIKLNPFYFYDMPTW
jgi:hypothetical protein